MTLLSDYLEKHPQIETEPKDILIRCVTMETIKEMSKAIATECLLHGCEEVTLTLFADIDGWKHLVDEKTIRLSGRRDK